MNTLTKRIWRSTEKPPYGDIDLLDVTKHGESDNVVDHKNVLNHIVEDSCGNFYSVGYSASFENEYCNSTAILFKHGSNGKTLWNRVIDNVQQNNQNHSDFGLLVTVDCDNNVYVIGTTSDDISDLPFTNRLFVIKYDENGNKKWRRLFYTKKDGCTNDTDTHAPISVHYENKALYIAVNAFLSGSRSCDSLKLFTSDPPQKSCDPLDESVVLKFEKHDSPYVAYLLKLTHLNKCNPCVDGKQVSLKGDCDENKLYAVKLTDMQFNKDKKHDDCHEKFFVSGVYDPLYFDGCNTVGVADGFVKQYKESDLECGNQYIYNEKTKYNVIRVDILIGKCHVWMLNVVDDDCVKKIRIIKPRKSDLTVPSPLEYLDVYNTERYDELIQKRSVLDEHDNLYIVTYEKIDHCYKVVLNKYDSEYNLLKKVVLNGEYSDLKSLLLNKCGYLHFIGSSNWNYENDNNHEENMMVTFVLTFDICNLDKQGDAYYFRFSNRKIECGIKHDKNYHTHAILSKNDEIIISGGVNDLLLYGTPIADPYVGRLEFKPVKCCKDKKKKHRKHKCDKLNLFDRLINFLVRIIYMITLLTSLPSLSVSFVLCLFRNIFNCSNQCDEDDDDECDNDKKPPKCHKPKPSKCSIKNCEC